MRASSATLWTVNALLAFAVLALVFWQWRAGQHLRAELAPLQTAARARTQLEAEQARLQAGQVSEAELARLRADHAALETLRTDLTALNARTDGRIKASSAPAVAAVISRQPGPVRPAAEWRNAGRAEPADVLETVAWATRNGDVDTLASLLTLESGKSALADALAALPAEERQHATPQQLIAREMIRDASLASFRQVDLQAQHTPLPILQVQLTTADGKQRNVALVFVKSRTQELSLRVPLSTTQYYAERILSRAAGRK